MKTKYSLLLLFISLFVHEITAQQTVIFERFTEQRENAFTILKPSGWIAEGGILRLDPTVMGGPANCIEAKFELQTLKIIQ